MYILRCQSCTACKKSLPVGNRQLVHVLIGKIALKILLRHCTR
jgi:hypothetical protein